MKNIIERLKVLPADKRTEKFSIALSNLRDDEGDFLTIDVLCAKQYVKEVEKYLNGETKYEPCAKCIKDTAQEVHQLFVAKEGDCYHSSLSCSGLTRLIRKVTIWEVEGMELCSRCEK